MSPAKEHARSKQRRMPEAVPAICVAWRATAGGWSKMSDEPLAREREPIDRVRARLEALLKANATGECDSDLAMGL
jgi:hypothetical protein